MNSWSSALRTGPVAAAALQDRTTGPFILTRDQRTARRRRSGSLFTPPRVSRIIFDQTESNKGSASQLEAQAHDVTGRRPICLAAPNASAFPFRRRGMTASLASREPTLVSRCAQPSRLLVLTEARFLGEALAAALEDLFRVEAVTCCNTAAALGLGLAAPADALLVDAAHSDGMPTARRLRQIAPTLPIIAYGVRDIEEEVVLWAEAGVTGYIPNTLELARLAHQIADILDGQQLCSARAAAALFRRVGGGAVPVSARSPSSPVRSLTRREREVAELIAAGLSDKQIARELNIGLATAKTHVHNLLGKLAVKQRREVVRVMTGDDRLPFRRTTPTSTSSQLLFSASA